MEKLQLKVKKTCDGQTDKQVDRQADQHDLNWCYTY